MMFGSNPLLDRMAALPGVIGEAGAMSPAALAAMASTVGPGGAMNDAGPTTINLTDASRYGGVPPVVGGGSMSAMNAPRYNPSADTPQTPAAPQPGMFGAPAKHKIDLKGIGLALAESYLASRASRGDRGAAAMLQGMQQQMLYRMKKRDADAQTAQYVQALVARGMDPNDAAIIAADPQEMAKHFGTRFDAATIDEGSSRYTPNLNGTADVFTAPKTFQNKADVTQMPGSQAVTQPYSMLGAGAAPQPVGTPASIPGLRTEAAQYADSLGLQSGTPAYANALQDYTLKGNGPTAFGFDYRLQQPRLQTQRDIASGHDATSAANSTRSTQAAIANNLRSTQTQRDVAAGHNQTMLGIASGHDSTRLRTSRRVRELPNEPVAVGPHGERLVVRNGAWVNSATGRPVQ